MDWGVDGMITNYPNKVRELMAERQMRLPRAYPARAAGSAAWSSRFLTPRGRWPARDGVRLSGEDALSASPWCRGARRSVSLAARARFAAARVGCGVGRLGLEGAARRLRLPGRQPVGHPRPDQRLGPAGPRLGR